MTFEPDETPAFKVSGERIIHRYTVIEFMDEYPWLLPNPNPMPHVDLFPVAAAAAERAREGIDRARAVVAEHLTTLAERIYPSDTDDWGEET